MHEQLSCLALGSFTDVFEHHLLLLFPCATHRTKHVDMAIGKDGTCSGSGFSHFPGDLIQRFTLLPPVTDKFNYKTCPKVTMFL